MARFYKVKIGSIFLTDNGLTGGRPCKTEVTNAPALIAPNIGNVSIAANGVGFREIPLSPTGAGRPFTITIPFVTSAVFGSLKTALDAAAAAGSILNITGDGLPGNFDVDADVFDNPVYLSWGSFSGDYVKNVVMSFLTRTIN